METVVRDMRNMLRNPLRLLLIVCLLGVSLMLVATMVSLNASVQQDLADVYQQVGTAITITYTPDDGDNNSQATAGQRPAGRTPLPSNAITTVKQTPGVTSVEERLSRSDAESTLKTVGMQGLDGKSFSVPPIVNGISTDATHFTLEGGATPVLVSGRGFQSDDANRFVAMMSQELAQANHLTIGSTFSLKGRTFTLIGLYTTEQTFARNSLIVPLTVMQNIFEMNGVDSITAYASSYELADSVAARLRTALGKAYNVVTEAANYTSTINTLIAVQKSIRLALLVAILTATLVIILAVFLTVCERTIEIGILKALGASHWQVIRQFWSEVLAQSVAAALLAVILLAALGQTISQMFTIPTNADTSRGVTVASSSLAHLDAHLTPVRLDIATLLIIVGLCMGLAMLASVIPAWYVARIKPARVLRRG